MRRVGMGRLLCMPGPRRPVNAMLPSDAVMPGRSRQLRKPPMKTNRQPPHLHPRSPRRALGWTDAATGAVVLPIQPATTYIRDPDNQYRGAAASYARADSAAYDQPEALLTGLVGGAASLVFASGMAAAATMFCALPVGAHRPPGREPCITACGAGSPATLPDGHIAADFVDTTSLDALQAPP